MILTPVVQGLPWEMEPAVVQRDYTIAMLLLGFHFFLVDHQGSAKMKFLFTNVTIPWQHLPPSGAPEPALRSCGYKPPALCLHLPLTLGRPRNTDKLCGGVRFICESPESTSSFLSHWRC